MWTNKIYISLLKKTQRGVYWKQLFIFQQNSTTFWKFDRILCQMMLRFGVRFDSQQSSTLCPKCWKIYYTGAMFMLFFKAFWRKFLRKAFNFI